MLTKNNGVKVNHSLNLIKPEIRQMIREAVTEAFINTTVVLLIVFYDEIVASYVMTKSEAYVSSVKLALNHMIKYFGPKMELSKIGVKEVEGFLGYIMKGAPRGYRVYFRNLKAAFNVAKNWGYIQSNPFLRIKLPKQQLNKAVYPTVEELDKIINQLKMKCLKMGTSKRRKEGYELIIDIIITAYFTGLRISEILNLKFNNVDFNNGFIIVGDAKFTTKGRNQRSVPMIDKIKELLEKRSIEKRDKSDFVFRTKSGKRFTKNYISKTYKKICRELGLDEGIRFHSNRHAFGSLLATKGVPIYHIKEIMGHASSITSERYSHVKEDTLKESIQVINSEVK